MRTAAHLRGDAAWRPDGGPLTPRTRILSSRVLSPLQRRCVLCNALRTWRDKSREKACRRCRKEACAGRRAAQSALSPAAARSPRARLDYSVLGRTTRARRRTAGRAALQEIGVPAEALVQSLLVPAEALVHLPQSARSQVRSVAGIKIPSERSVRASKLSLANAYGTATGVFERGAFVQDPAKLLRLAAAQSPFLAVGGDTGGGQTKLGVTYLNQRGAAAFLSLVVYDGTDSWEELERLRRPSQTPFAGESTGWSNVWAFLQHLLNERAAFLHGDWLFLNVVLGLKGPGSLHPCPICIVEKRFLLAPAPYRIASDTHSVFPDRVPLLTCNSTRIVPSPLHVFLGIGNRFIEKVYRRDVGDETLAAVMRDIKTVHAAGNGGQSDLWALNGAELKAWIKQGFDATIRALGPSQTPDQQLNYETIAVWLAKLEGSLLHARKWTRQEALDFHTLVLSMHHRWQAVTGTEPFPKLHMLVHCAEFASTHLFLGRLSEAPIESHHAQFNKLFQKQHLNSAKNPTERLRRSLADVCLRAAQPKALADRMAELINASAAISRAHSI